MRVRTVVGAFIGGILVVSLATPAAAPPSATSFRLGLYDAAGPASSAVAAVLSPDGSLRFPGVEPGRYSIRTPTTAVNTSWSLTSVLLDQQEVIDSSFETGVGQNIENVTLTFTNRLGHLSGSVLDRAGAPATERA